MGMIIWISTIPKDEYLELAGREFKIKVVEDVYHAISELFRNEGSVMVVNERSTSIDIDRLKEVLVTAGLVKDIFAYKFPSEENEVIDSVDKFLFKLRAVEEFEGEKDDWPITPPAGVDKRQSQSLEEEETESGTRRQSEEGEFIPVRLTDEEIKALLGEQDGRS